MCQEKRRLLSKTAREKEAAPSRHFGACRPRVFCLEPCLNGHECVCECVCARARVVAEVVGMTERSPVLNLSGARTRQMRRNSVCTELPR